MRISWMLSMLLVCVACQGEHGLLSDADAHLHELAAELQAEAAGGASESLSARRPPHAGKGGDRDKCARDNGGCEQICKELPRSHVCECEPGAYLKSDRRSCWQWHGAERLESYDGGDASEPRVASDLNGSAVVVWTQATGEARSIWSSRSLGSGWGSPVQIDGGDPRGGAGPQVTVASGGNAVSLWRQATGQVGYLVNRTSDETWGAPELLFESAPSSQFYGPFLSGSRNGAALVLWGSTAGRGSTLAASTLAGTTWTTVALPLGSAVALPTLGHLHAASGPNGEGAVMWSQGDTNPPRLWLNQARNGSWLATPLQVDVSAAPDFSQASLAIVRGPAELVVWSAGPSILANRRTSDWTGALKIRDAAARVTITSLQVVSDARGMSAFAIWLENDGTRTGVWTSHFSGDAWSPAVNIEALSVGDAGSPAIALAPSGSAVAVWSHAGAHVDIWANRYTPASGWGTAVRLEDEDSGDAAAPSVAVDSRGNARAVWQQSDGVRNDVFGNHFD